MRQLFGTALCSALLTSCAYAPRQRLLQDPFEHRPAAQLAAYSVTWWQRLVTETPLLEWAPREPASPAVDAETGRVIAQTRDGYIRCFRSDGTEDWKYRTYARASAGATVEAGIAYVPASNGRLIAFRMSGGEKLWEYDSGEELITVPRLVDGRIYVASQNDTLFVVDQKTGKWIWQYRRDPPAGFTIRGASAPLVHNGRVYIGFADGHFVALSAADGALVWDKALSTGTQFIDVDTSPAVDAAGDLYVASYKDGLFKVSSEDGSVRWHTAVAGLNTLVLRGSVLYAGGDEILRAYSARDGSPVWSVALKKRPARSPIFADGFLVVPTTEELLFVNPANGVEQLRFDPGRGVTATPVLLGRHLFVLSNGGYLYDLLLGTQS